MTRRVHVALALLLSACATAEGERPTSAPVADADRADGFALDVSSERSVYDTDDAIEVETTLTYEGVAGATAWGSGHGLVGFTVERLEDGLTPGSPVFTAECVPHEFEPGARVIIPFAKTGAYDEDTRNADFVRRYLDDPELHLPAGTWRITATATGYLGETCGPPELHLEASIELRVLD